MPTSARLRASVRTGGSLGRHISVGNGRGPHHRTVKGFILKLIEEPIQEMGKKGLLPKRREA